MKKLCFAIGLLLVCISPLSAQVAMRMQLNQNIFLMNNAREMGGRQACMVKNVVLNMVIDVVRNNHTYIHIDNHISDQIIDYICNHKNSDRIACRSFYYLIMSL